MMLRARSIVGVALAALLLGLVCWTVLPAPVLPALALSVAAPELAPYALAALAVFGVLAAYLARGRARTVALTMLVLALPCVTWPLLAAPFAARAADMALAQAGIPAARAEPIASIDTLRDIPVRLRDGARLALDLYRPRLRGDLPLVVAIYGGGWRFGTRAQVAGLARWYAARGFAVAAVDYRHAPAYRFPVQRDDVEDALRTIALNARVWRIDPRRVALFGRSAGAELALLLAERPGPLPLAAVVAYYAPVDLTRGWNEPPRPDPADTRGILRDYLGGPPDAQHAAAYRAASPLDQAQRNLPPILLIGGQRDELVEIAFSRAFARRLRALDDRVVEIELPWSNHAFDEVDGLGAAIAHAATLRFLDALLRGDRG